MQNYLKFFFLLKLRLKLASKLLVSGLAEKREHILLVRLNAGLVEGIYAEHITRKCASDLEEVDEVTERVRASVLHFDKDIGHAAVNVSKQSSLHSGLLYLVEINAREEVKSVDVGLLFYLKN